VATEQLVIELNAKTAKLDAKLNSTNDKLDKLAEKTKKADGAFNKIAGGAKMAGTALVKTAAAATALAAAVTAVVISSANGRRDLELLAKQAKTTTGDFQALAFAASRYGINADQMGDISKEISLKIAEFATAGTGAFQDYADVMGLTKDEARLAANEFENMSSQEILGTMVSRMEEAGANAGDMSFALDSLASDSERLLPLFRGNSKELTELKKRFDDVNQSLFLTGTQAAALQDVSNTFTLMTSSIGNATTAISATLAPVFDDFFNDIIDIVPDATQTIIDFVNSFLDAENITSIAGVTKEIAASNKEIAMQKGIIDKDLNPRATKAAKSILKTEKERKEELEAQLIILQNQEKSIQNANRLNGGQIGGATGEGVDDTSKGLGTGDEIQAIADRFKEEETLLAEKLVRELQIIGDNNELKLELEKEFAENINEIRLEAAEKKAALEAAGVNEFKGGTKEEIIANKQAADKKLNQQQSAIRAGMALNTLLFEDNKAVSAGLIVADTAAAIMASLRINPYDYFNVGLLATTGAVQLANALSSSKGGGGSLSAPPSASRQAPQQSFNDQGATITDISDGEMTSQSLIIEFNDEVVDALSRQIQKSQSDGRT
jgi:hypothetical protein